MMHHRAGSCLIATELHASQIVSLDPELDILGYPRGIPAMEGGRKEAKGVMLAGPLQQMTNSSV